MGNKNIKKDVKKKKKVDTKVTATTVIKSVVTQTQPDIIKKVKKEI